MVRVRHGTFLVLGASICMACVAGKERKEGDPVERRLSVPHPSREPRAIRNDGERPPVQVAWEQGKRYTYKVKSAASMRFGPKLEVFDFELSGRAEVVLLGRVDGRVTLHFSIPDAAITDRMTQAQSPVTAAAIELQRGGCTAVLVNGLVAEIGIPRNMSPGAAAMYRQLVAALQVAHLEQNQTERVAEEYDGTGKYLARYIVSEDRQTILKTKEKYLGLVGLGPTIGGRELRVVPEVVTSRGSLKVSRDGLLSEVVIEDQVTLRGAQAPVDSRVEFRAELDSVVDDARSADRAVWAAEYVLLPVSSPQIGTASPAALDRARTGGNSFEELFAGYQRAKSMRASAAEGRKAKKAAERPTPGAEGRSRFAEEARLFSGLVGAIRQESGAVESAVRRINSKSPYSGDLLDALGSASSTEAEAALIVLINSKDQDAALKERTLQALARMPNPGDKAVAVMKDVLGRDPLNPRALYALGSYSRHFRDQGKRDAARELGEYLVARLDETPGPSGKVTVLRAIGNSGYVGALPAVKAYLAHKDEVVRAVALGSLRSMLDPSVDGILATQLASDSSADVQIAAIDAVRVRAPSDTLVAAVVAASGTTERRVRYRAVELMAEWLPRRADLRGRLEKVSREDPEPKIRERAKAVL